MEFNAKKFGKEVVAQFVSEHPDAESPMIHGIVTLIASIVTLAIEKYHREYHSQSAG